MNSSNAPMLADSAATAGMIFTPPQTELAEAIDSKLLGLSCVELIGRLECEFVKAKEFQPSDYIDESAETARKMLALLAEFSNDNLGDASIQANDEIQKANAVSYTYDEVLKTRPLGNALLRAFWKAEEVEDIKVAHKNLGQSTIRAIAATLYHAIMIIGFDSEMGKEIDQSTVLIITELNKSW